MSSARWGVLALVALVLVVSCLPPMAMASDLKVKAGSGIDRRETVDRGEVDGYHFKLEEGDKVAWTVNHVSGQAMDILFMPKDNYDQLASGQGTPWYYQELSKERTEYIDVELKAKSPYIGEFAVVVRTLDVENATTTYDIDVKHTKAPEPQGLLDQLCGLGTGTCIGLVVVSVVVLMIALYMFRRTAGEGAKKEVDRGRVSYVDTMMRPGFDIPVMPEPEPEQRPRRKRGRKRKGGKATRKKGGKKVRRPREGPSGGVVEPEVMEVVAIPECPHCGEALEEGSDFCPSCGSRL